MDRVVAAPVAPALGDDCAGFGVEGDAEAERRARVGVVGGGHAEVHDGMAFCARGVLEHDERAGVAFGAPQCHGCSV